MWRLQNIYANNLCSFKELDYDVLQGCTTLIFGNNMDNDSQGSNGSGKSTMLEAVAIGITGESLRKVKTEEVINDSESTAIVRLTLNNVASLKTMVVTRTFYRKGSQNISIQITNNDNVTEDVVCASVGDYNKYILEAIGLTKDEVFSTFVLSKHKYNSFLAASDKEKKELINRFSNGNMVDESISMLHDDISYVESDLQKQELEIANISGKIAAYDEQINEAIQDIDKKKARKEEMIAEWKEKIANERKKIREIKQLIEESESRFNDIDKVEEFVQNLEHSEEPVKKCFDDIQSIFKKYNIGLYDIKCDIDDIKEQLSSILEKYEDFKSKYKYYEDEIEEQNLKCEQMKKKQEEIDLQNNQALSELDKKRSDISSIIEKAESEIKYLKAEEKKTLSDIANLQLMITGLIVCPSCGHEFIVGKDVDVHDTRHKISDLHSCAEELKGKIDDKSTKLKQDYSYESDLKNEYASLKSKIMKSGNDVYEEYAKLNSMVVKSSSLKMQLQTMQNKIESLQNDISKARIRLFDDVYDIIDMNVKGLENSLKYSQKDINRRESLIECYESSIRELALSNDNDSVEYLKDKQKSFHEALSNATERKSKIAEKLDCLKIQESTFIDFKTHLANTKIEALSNITNEFLEAIGSDLRIVFSGFTVLKSGKIRDKISISLVRDGVDCGSFDKHSEGEKARVNLASILALHKLTNMNCDNEKGLDLLVLDEILEATDEQGLSNIFQALNKLKITSLIVSHGQLAENYPYKVVVNKKNNVSYIND